MEDVLTMILAGGVGSRLNPLTADRAKPAVPFGGQYRIIDFTLSNCLHSSLRRILVLPQYKSHSLMKHLRDGWSVYNPNLGEYVTPVPPQMRTDDSWYQGTADAIYQNLYLLDRSGARDVVVLSGDHIYRMDYAGMVNFHRRQAADATVACMSVPLDEARSFGVMTTDESSRITRFDEKPRYPTPIPDAPDRAMASMGIYVFSLNVLADALRRDHADPHSTRDFGRDVLPALLKTHDVCAYQFGGETGRVTADRYWRDVGTIDAYFEANMDLLKPVPPIDLYQPDWRIRTADSQSPPARTCRSACGAEPRLVNSIISPGAIVSGGVVVNSILSPGVRVHAGAQVVDSVLFEGVTVGPGARLNRCIVDKRVAVPAGAVIDREAMKASTDCVVSEKGVVVLPKDFSRWNPQGIQPPGTAARRTHSAPAVIAGVR